MRAIQLGADMHRKIEPPHGAMALRWVRQRHGKIAAETDQRLGPSVNDGLHRGYRVMAMHRRRFEAEDALNAGQQGGSRFFGDADRTVPLHIGMTSQWADARAGFSEIASQ